MGVKLREKKMKDESSSLYLDIYHKGKRKYEFLNIHLSNKRKFRQEDREKRELAQKLRIKKENELLNQETGLFNKNSPDADFYTFYDEFLKTKNSFQTYWNSVKNYIKAYSERKDYLPFSDISEEWMLGFQKYLLSKTSNNTTLEYINLISETLNNARRNNIIASNPYMTIAKSEKLSKIKNDKKTYLSIDELEKFSKLKVKKEYQQVKQIFIFSCFTGLRWGDVHLLKWSNISEIERKDCKVKVLSFKQNKTRQQEYMPLSKQAIVILNEIKSERKNKEYIFDKIALETKNRSYYSVISGINNKLKTMAKNAEIEKNIHFHVARHTFATMSLTHGIDIYTVSKLLGHKSIEMTTVYAKVVDTKKAEAVAKMPKLKLN